MTGTSAGRPPADYGPIQLAEHAQLPRWLIERALAEKLVPGPDVDGRRWSAAVADEVACRAEQIKTTLGTEHPIGANRAAERVAARTGLDVDGDDIRQVAEHGHLHAVDEYKGWPLFDCRDLDELDPGVLDPFIAERVAWHEASCSRYDAAARLGWSVRELQRVAAERGLTPGRFGRYATGDIDDLAADDALDDDVRGNRLLGPDQAAQHLDIRRVDFDYCLTAGWICPHQWVDSQVSRRRTVPVPLYRLADVEALRDIPGLDWEAVRAARPSPPHCASSPAWALPEPPWCGDSPLI